MTAPAVFALFGRALREDTRRGVTYVLRACVLILPLVVLSFQLAIPFRSGARGLEFFAGIVWVDLILITLAGLSEFASPIAEEKEEQSLGLLQMAGLGPVSILAGKSGPRFFGALALLVIQAPLVLLSIPLGGVSMGQILAAYATLLAWTLCVGSVGLFASVVCRRTGTASAFTFATLLILFVGPLIWLWNQSVQKYSGGFLPAFLADGLEPVATFFLSAAPFERLDEILSTGFSDPPAGQQVLYALAIAAVFLLLARLLFDRFNRESQEASPTRGLLFRRGTRLSSLGAGRAWRAALAWKEFHFLAGGFLGIALRTILFAALFAFVVWIQRNNGGAMFWPETGGVLMVCACAIFFIHAGILASRTLREEIQWKTLSALFSLPLTARSIVWSKIAGGLISFFPTFLLFGVGFLRALPRYDRILRDVFDEAGFWYVISIGIVFVQLCATLSLYLKRLAFVAALALCIFQTFIVQAVVVSSMGYRSLDTAVALAALLNLAATFILHRRMLTRMERLAGE